MDTLAYSVNLSPIGGELAVLSAGVQKIPPGGAIGSYMVPHYSLNYMESGEGEYDGEWGKIGLTEGDCFIVPPNRYIRARATTPGVFRFVTFAGRAAEAELDRIGFSPALPVYRAADPLETTKWFEKVLLLLLDQSEHYDFAAEAYLRLLLAGLTGRTEPEPYGEKRPAQLPQRTIDPHIRLVVEWISARFDLPLTVSELARKAGYSERYFRKAFRRITGLSPTELLARIRIDRAKHLLLRPLSVKQIALSVGYRDPLYFSKQFKKRTGLSPVQYRECAQERLAAGDPP